MPSESHSDSKPERQGSTGKSTGDLFNPQLGQNLMNGNQAIYHLVLRNFVELYADLPDQIERLIRDNNQSGLVRLCHNLKSTTGQAGSVEVAAQSAALEKSIKASPWPLDDSFHQQLEHYCQDIAELKRQVEAYLETLGSATAAAAQGHDSASNVLPPQSDDHQQARAIVLRQLQAHLGEHDPVNSRQALNQLLQLDWPESSAGTLRQISKLLSQYKFEQALDLVIQMANK